MPEELDTRIEILSIDEKDNYAKFTMMPLERGYGTTLGNSLRRVLLSTLPGDAITKISIQNVLHEFTSINGVIEDVAEIILNIKGIALKKHSEEPVVLVLEAEGEGVITAGDITEDADIEIINKDHHIATLNTDGKIYMELVVDSGKGYSVADKHKDEDDSIGTISIDASYTPVRKVNFEVENTRVGQDIDYDKLTLEVWTNGTISPQQVTADAAQILINNLDFFLDLPDKVLYKEEEVEEEEDLSKQFEMNIEELDLSLRSFNCLKRAGIDSVGDILDKTETEMSKIKNFGKKSLTEVKNKIEEMGFNFKEEE